MTVAEEVHELQVGMHGLQTQMHAHELHDQQRHEELRGGQQRLERALGQFIIAQLGAIVLCLLLMFGLVGGAVYLGAPGIGEVRVGDAGVGARGARGATAALDTEEP